MSGEKGNMTQEQITAYQEVRKTLIERLRRLEIAGSLLDDMSLFQLMNLLWLMAGHVSYLGVYPNTCWTLEELFGKDALFDKPSEQRAQSAKIESESKPVVN
jgi:hypothetical protein